MNERGENLSNRDFARLRELISKQAGIQVGQEKQTMLEVRIGRRLKELKIDSYGDYCEYLFGPRGMKEELVSLIDAVTTNKTDFFREPKHFEFLTAKALDEMTERAPGKPIFFWSAGCASGEEPYTLAMVLSEYALMHPGFRFRILATDISTAVLKKAERGIYSEEVASAIAPCLRQRYLMRSRDHSSGLVRVVPELRGAIEFRRLNFMDSDYGCIDRADGIFCRNVMIYFDRPTQERILGRLVRHLVPGGYLFVGHAETLHDMNLPLAPIAPSLYRRSDAA